MIELPNLRSIVRPAAGADAAAAAVEIEQLDGRVRWSVHARAEPVALDAVAFEWDAGPAGGDPRMFVQGYQSWAPTRTVRIGVERDPSLDPRPIPLVRAAFHADPGVVDEGELRSEQVTVLATGRPHLLCTGFAAGDRHAGTIRVRVVDGRVIVRAEAWLGGAVIEGERVLHDVLFDEGDDAGALLDGWATHVGREEHARVSAPFQVGWCSWYHYFHLVTEAQMRDNLARAGEWPFDVFQLDDGYQHAIGDWLRTNERFPRGIEPLAHDIARAGYVPGIWIAPFLAAPDSDAAHDHPEWLAGAPAGDGFAIGMYNEPWGGVMALLDTTHPAVVDHLERTAAALVAAGYRYLKLDFTFAAAMPGRFHDPARTPAERVRAGFDAIRRGAGNDAFILGCGAPIGAVVGAVDGMRIGADVAPWWDAPAGEGEQMPGYEATTPSTHNAFVNTCTRSFMHRRLWLNDPDCVMLRATETRLSPRAAAGWAETVGCSGGLVLLSDDLALLDSDARALLDDVITRGRAADEGARNGDRVECLGLIDADGPFGVRGAGGTVRIDPGTGARVPDSGGR